jgi:uncharacterized integral membrane protein
MADDTTRDSRREGLHPAFVVGVVLALALLDFVLQNTNDVRVHFLFLSTDKPLWLLLLVTSALAIGASEVFSFVWRRRKND